MKRSEKKEKREREILAAALDLFIKKGYGSTKTAEIAAAANIGEGLLFHYYETKAALYKTLIDIALSGRETSMSIDSCDPVRYFQKTAAYIIESCTADLFKAKLFLLMNEAESNAFLPLEVRDNIRGENELKKSAEIIKRGQKSEVIKQGDPLSLASLFWIAVHGVVETMAKKPEIPVPDPDWIVDILRVHRNDRKK